MAFSGRSAGVFLAGVLSGGGVVGIVARFRPEEKKDIQSGAVASSVLSGAPSNRLPRYEAIFR